LHPAGGRPTGPIVWDLEEGVKQCEAWGENIPWYRPERCPGCGASGTLVGHGRRVRKKSGVGVRRLRCGRVGRTGTCGKTCTVTPSFLYPGFWYGLYDVAPVLMGRYGQVPPKTWRELARNHSASERTLSRWCAAFSAAAADWVGGLLTALAQVRQEFALTRSVSDGPERLTLSLAALFLDWRERSQTGRQLDESQLLQRLWGWGSQRLKIPLFLSTTNVKGLRQLRAPKRGPPTP